MKFQEEYRAEWNWDKNELIMVPVGTVKPNLTFPKIPRYKFVVYEVGIGYSQRNLGEYLKINHAILAMKTFMKQRMDVEIVVLDIHAGVWMQGKAPIATSYPVSRITTCTYIGKYFIGDVWTDTPPLSSEAILAMKEKAKGLNTAVKNTNDWIAEAAHAFSAFARVAGRTPEPPFGSQQQQN
jgi:hypothetical protein